MKINLKPRTMMYPAPAVVASAYDEDGNPDCCTLAFATMCSHHPPAVMIAEHMDETDYFGIESGYNQNKLEKVNFSYRDAEMVNAPIIEEFKVSVECRVINIAEVGSHTQVTGEIVNIQADESVVDGNGKIIFEKLDSLAYDDVTHSYFRMGDKISDAFKPGRKFM